jgi:hypothetical protein
MFLLGSGLSSTLLQRSTFLAKLAALPVHVG